MINHTSAIIAAWPGAGQEYFDKCSLSCHPKFGFASLWLSPHPGWPSKSPDKKAHFILAQSRASGVPPGWGAQDEHH
jgi:hypothetical protein